MSFYYKDKNAQTKAQQKAIYIRFLTHCQMYVKTQRHKNIQKQRQTHIQKHMQNKNNLKNVLTFVCAFVIIITQSNKHTGAHTNVN